MFSGPFVGVLKPEALHLPEREGGGISGVRCRSNEAGVKHSLGGGVCGAPEMGVGTVTQNFHQKEQRGGFFFKQVSPDCHQEKGGVERALIKQRSTKQSKFRPKRGGFQKKNKIRGIKKAVLGENP